MEQNEIDREVTRLLNTSASDCAISVEGMANRQPANALAVVGAALVYMNNHGIGRKSHRQALMKAGRLALKTLGES